MHIGNEKLDGRFNAVNEARSGGIVLSCEGANFSVKKNATVSDESSGMTDQIEVRRCFDFSRNSRNTKQRDCEKRKPARLQCSGVSDQSKQGLPLTNGALQ